MGFEPVGAKAAVSNEGNGHVEGILHFFDNDVFHFVLFFWIDGEVEFVVNLEDHFTLDVLYLEAIEDVNHCDFDDVGSRALNGGIDSITFCKAANHTIGTIDVR